MASARDEPHDDVVPALTFFGRGADGVRTPTVDGIVVALQPETEPSK